jgi:chromosome segregation ATPase
VKKCRELNTEIVANAAKVQTALKLSEEDQITISSLRKEIEKAWKMVDASHEKEARAKETISHLKMEIANLTRLVEQGAGISLGEEAAVNELIKQKEELIKELDQKVGQHTPCIVSSALDLSLGTSLSLPAHVRSAVAVLAGCIH